MKKQLLLLAALVAAGSQVCLAAGNPWNGTWKLNDAKSNRTGSVDTLSKGPDGKYTVSTSGLTFTFGCDGAEYPIPGGRMLICNKVSDIDMRFIVKAGGDELAQTERTLSDGGKTMTVVSTGKTADGTVFHDVDAYKKISGGDSWEGGWQNTKVQTSTHGVAVIEATADSISFTYPMAKASLIAKLDGTPASEQGPHPEEGMTISMTAAGAHSIHEVDTLNGTVVEHDTLTVSPDGKTMTIDVQRTGGKVNQTYVYDKQ